MDISFDDPKDFNDRVTVIAAVTQAMCEAAGESPNYGVALILQAAVSVCQDNSSHSIVEIRDRLVGVLRDSFCEDASHVRH